MLAENDTLCVTTYLVNRVSLYYERSIDIGSAASIDISTSNRRRVLRHRGKFPSALSLYRSIALSLYRAFRCV